MSTEPSMEEILSSIKRIIAEEGEAAVTTRSRRGKAAARREAPVVEEVDEDEILELSQPVTDAKQQPAQPAPADPILSDRAAEATRGPLEALSRIVVKPEIPGSDTLEGMVREMLKPMLRDWLDENLPRIVETMVAREISRITGRN
jgi:cell pole-organizing protein PopZ